MNIIQCELGKSIDHYALTLNINYIILTREL